jgi:hypothetical protein
MRTRSFLVCAVTLMAASVLLVRCGDGPKSNLPTSPTLPHAASVQISGPSSVAPGQSIQFQAVVSQSDGTTKVATSPTSRWNSSNPAVLAVNAAGVVSAGSQRGEAVLTVEVSPSGPSSLRRGSREILVLPDGTYRVVGSVVDAEIPTAGVPGALVEVTSGTPVSTTAGANGEYRLYGVAPDADIRVTAGGYQAYVQTVHLTANASINFPLQLSGPRPTITGNYTLAIDVVGCQFSSSLPADLQHRSYDVLLTQNGPTVDVVLTEPRFRLNGANRGNWFRGSAVGGGVSFTLDYYDYYYTTQYPSIAERLPDGTFLVTQGTTLATSSGSGFSGVINNGSIDRWDAGFPTNSRWLGGCYGTLRLTLAPR